MPPQNNTGNEYSIERDRQPWSSEPKRQRCSITIYCLFSQAHLFIVHLILRWCLCGLDATEPPLGALNILERGMGKLDPHGSGVPTNCLAGRLWKTLFASFLIFILFYWTLDIVQHNDPTDPAPNPLLAYVFSFLQPNICIWKLILNFYRHKVLLKLMLCFCLWWC